MAIHLTRRFAQLIPTVLGIVHLKDVVKEGMRHRFDQLRAMGIRTVMVTGDNRLTAAKIGDPRTPTSGSSSRFSMSSRGSCCSGAESTSS